MTKKEEGALLVTREHSLVAFEDIVSLKVRRVDKRQVCFALFGIANAEKTLTGGGRVGGCSLGECMFVKVYKERPVITWRALVIR